MKYDKHAISNNEGGDAEKMLQEGWAELVRKYYEGGGTAECLSAHSNEHGSRQIRTRTYTWNDDQTETTDVSDVTWFVEEENENV